jgi:protease I
MRIACVLDSGFEDSEFRLPYDRFRAAGHEVTIVGLNRGERLRGKRGQEEVTVEVGIDEARPRDAEALFIPGGHSPDRLRADERVVDYVRAFAQRPIFAVCHGPQLLITAEMVRGRRMTAWKTVQKDLRCCGALVEDRPVVVDGNLVTSRRPEDLEVFAREALDLMATGAGAHA